jgi:hypothetical protein
LSCGRAVQFRKAQNFVPLLGAAFRARTPNAERQTPNAKRQTPNAKRRTPNAERRSPEERVTAASLYRVIEKHSFNQ